MTPLEYKTFCESTYACPEEYLRLLLVKKLGKVASLFAKAMRDGVSRRVQCDNCDSTGWEAILIPKFDKRFKGGKTWEDSTRLCQTCDAEEIRIYGPEAVDRDALLRKLGDVMWCAAMLDDRQNIVAWPVEKPWWLNDRPASEMLGDIWAEFDDGASALMWACFAVIKLGFAPEEVATANVEKLKGRRERGTIHGAGDER